MTGGQESPFVTGGALPLGATTYIERSHDDQCFQELAANKWVLLLGPRQQGKTSTLIRLRERLLDAGYTCILVDMQAYAAQSDDYGSMLRWLAVRLARATQTSLTEPPAMDRDDLDAWLSLNSPGSGAIAVLLDEVGAVPTQHRVRFFSQLRALYNGRAVDEDAIGNRLAFLFAGTFRPERMIETGNSPFNVSVEVRPSDLTLSEVEELAEPLGSDVGAWARRVHDYVGGQPYLSQVYLESVSPGQTDEEREALWLRTDDKVRRGGEERHLTQLFGQVLSEPSLQRCVAEVVTRGSLAFSPANDDHVFLQVLGVCKAAGGELTMRNFLYAETARAMPQIVGDHPVPAKSGSLVVMRSETDFDVVVDPKLRQLAVDTYRSAISAYQCGHFRLALVSFGSALETLLLDFLEQLKPNDLAAAVASVQPKFRPTTAPAGDWKFVHMVNVAHETTKLRAARKSLSHQVRDWRNLIHPNKARADFQSEVNLEPDARMAVAVCDKVLLELSQ